MVGGSVAAGAAVLGWASGVEVRSFRVRRVEVPVLATVIAMLFVGHHLIAVIRHPIDNALQSRGISDYKEKEGEKKLEDRSWRF